MQSTWEVLGGIRSLTPLNRCRVSWPRRSTGEETVLTLWRTSGNRNTSSVESNDLWMLIVKQGATYASSSLAQMFARLLDCTKRSRDVTDLCRLCLGKYTPWWWNTPHCVSQNGSLLLSEAWLKSSWLRTCVIHDIIHVDDLIVEIARVARLKFVRQTCQLETLRQGILLRLWVRISSPQRKVILCFSLFSWLNGSHSHCQIPAFFQVVTVNLNLSLMCLHFSVSILLSKEERSLAELSYKQTITL